MNIYLIFFLLDFLSILTLGVIISKDFLSRVTVNISMIIAYRLIPPVGFLSKFNHLDFDIFFTDLI